MLPQSEYFKLWRVRVIRYFCNCCEVEVEGRFESNPLQLGDYCEKCYKQIDTYSRMVRESSRQAIETFKNELKAQAAIEKCKTVGIGLNDNYIPAGYGRNDADYYSTSPGISSDTKPLNRKLVDAMEAGVLGGSKPLCPPTLSGMNVGLGSIGKHEYQHAQDLSVPRAYSGIHTASNTSNSPDVDKNGFSIKHWQEKAAFEEGLKLSDDIARARADGYKGGYEAGYANAKLDSSSIPVGSPGDVLRGEGWSNK